MEKTILSDLSRYKFDFDLERYRMLLFYFQTLLLYYNCMHGYRQHQPHALMIHIIYNCLVFQILAIQIICFHEIITIGYVVYRSHDLPWFRTLSWYFLITSNYFFYGESMVQYFGLLMSRTVREREKYKLNIKLDIPKHNFLQCTVIVFQEFMKPFLTYHRFLSFSLYCGGIVAFVMSLKKKYYLKQFTLVR